MKLTQQHFVMHIMRLSKIGQNFFQQCSSFLDTFYTFLILLKSEISKLPFTDEIKAKRIQYPSLFNLP